MGKGTGPSIPTRPVGDPSHRADSSSCGSGGARPGGGLRGREIRRSDPGGGLAHASAPGLGRPGAGGKCGRPPREFLRRSGPPLSGAGGKHAGGRIRTFSARTGWTRLSCSDLFALRAQCLHHRRGKWRRRGFRPPRSRSSGTHRDRGGTRDPCGQISPGSPCGNPGNAELHQKVVRGAIERLTRGSDASAPVELDATWRVWTNR